MIGKLYLHPGCSLKGEKISIESPTQTEHFYHEKQMLYKIVDMSILKKTIRPTSNYNEGKDLKLAKESLEEITTLKSGLNETFIKNIQDISDDVVSSLDDVKISKPLLFGGISLFGTSSLIILIFLVLLAYWIKGKVANKGKGKVANKLENQSNPVSIVVRKKEMETNALEITTDVPCHKFKQDSLDKITVIQKELCKGTSEDDNFNHTY